MPEKTEAGYLCARRRRVVTTMNLFSYVDVGDIRSKTFLLQ